VVHLSAIDMHTFVLNYRKNEPFNVILTKLVFAPVKLTMLIYSLSLQKQNDFKDIYIKYSMSIFSVVRKQTVQPKGKKLSF
jgi:hypothetical protein